MNMAKPRGTSIALGLALLLSLLLHAAVLVGPVWGLGGLPDDPAPAMLEATLIAPPTPRPRPVLRPKLVPAPVPLAANADAGTPAPSGAVPSAPVADPAPAEPSLVVAEMPEEAPPLPRQGRIRFTLIRGLGGFVVGQSIHEWQHDGRRYSLTATSETTGLAALFKPAKVVQASEGGFRNGELKPDNFRFDRGGGDVETAQFDWAGGQVALNNEKSFAIAGGAEDGLSMFYQLMQAAQKGEAFIMPVATGRKVERYAFEWLGEDVLSLRVGTIHAWHVRVKSAGGGADTIEVWLGREVLGLPVKIRQTDRKGDVFDLVAEEINYEGKK
jgi:hypothetical protein